MNLFAVPMEWRSDARNAQYGEDNKMEKTQNKQEIIETHFC